MQLNNQIIETAGILDESFEAQLLTTLETVRPEHYFGKGFRGKLASSMAYSSSFAEPLPALFLRMLSLSNFIKKDKVLELFPSLGFSTSVLSSLGAYVFSVYQNLSQAQNIRNLLDEYGYHNALVRTGSSERVWNQHEPYDSIFVYKPIAEVSFELLEMLNPDGGVLIALLQEDDGLRLCTWTRTEEGLQTVPLEFIEVL